MSIYNVPSARCWRAVFLMHVFVDRRTNNNIQVHSNAQRENSNPAWGHERTRGWVHSPSMANRCSEWSPCLESAFTSLVIKCKKHIKKRAGCLPLLGRRALPVRFRKLCVWLLWMAFSSRSRSNGFNICGGYVWGCWNAGVGPPVRVEYWSLLIQRLPNVTVRVLVRWMKHGVECVLWRGGTWNTHPISSSAGWGSISDGSGVGVVLSLWRFGVWLVKSNVSL